MSNCPLSGTAGPFGLRVYLALCFALKCTLWAPDTARSEYMVLALNTFQDARSECAVSCWDRSQNWARKQKASSSGTVITVGHLCGGPSHRCEAVISGCSGTWDKVYVQGQDLEVTPGTLGGLVTTWILGALGRLASFDY